MYFSQKIFKNKNTEQVLYLNIELNGSFSIVFQDHKTYINLEDYMQLNSYLFSLDYIELIEIKEV